MKTNLSETCVTLKAIKKMHIPLGAAEVTPGEILREEFMEPLGLSVRELARRMNVGPMRVSQIIRGQRAITADTALRLGATFKTTAQFWLNLQNNYDLAHLAKASLLQSVA
jgi:addiction module HigA family antidote